MPDSASSQREAREIEGPTAPAPEAELHRDLELQNVLLLLLTVMAVAAALFFAREVFLPIALATLLSIVLSPLVRGLYRIGLPEPIGAALVMLCLLLTLGYGFYRLATPATEWVRELPQHVEQAQDRLSAVLWPLRVVQQAGQSVSSLTDGTAPAEPQQADAAKPRPQQQQRQEPQQRQQPGQAPGQPPAPAQPNGSPGLFSYTTTVLVGFGATIVLTYFLLACGDLFLRKLVAVLPRLRDKKTAIDIVQQVQRDMSAYLFTITLINVGLGTVIGLILWALGLPTPVLWGAMVALFNFVPYLGPITSFGVISLVSVLTFDGVGEILLPPLCFLVITLLEGNFFTPAVVAKRLTLNTVAVFIAILFWGWMWGIPGTFMAVPLLAIFKIMCDRIEPMHPIGEFLAE